jgi:hypothetical protein
MSAPTPTMYRNRTSRSRVSAVIAMLPPCVTDALAEPALSGRLGAERRIRLASAGAEIHRREARLAYRPRPASVSVPWRQRRQIARFVMLKPSVIYCVVGTLILRPGWMNRYVPPRAIEVVPDVAYAFGFAWAGLMFASAALNGVLALTLDPLTWSAVVSAWGIASKLALFVTQYFTMRAIGRRRLQVASST